MTLIDDEERDLTSEAKDLFSAISVICKSIFFFSTNPYEMVL